ncbi:hypothetical protein [Altererythrobacter sp. Z27]|uniref:hypothetical protein n=1 Tax=Altererythrobacter sp. Z27 TaxID=3461147 RepID=UPI0040450206
MTKALADMFADAQAPCLHWEGEPAYAIYEMPAPEAFDVEFVSSTDTPVQGLTLKVYGGVLEIDGVEAQEMLLWRDTAPNRVPVKVKSETGGRATLKIWNVWRGKVGGHDVTQAWLGNAGMRVKQVGTWLALHCSDGEGSVDFDDLAVHLTVVD